MSYYFRQFVFYEERPEGLYEFYTKLAMNEGPSSEVLRSEDSDPNKISFQDMLKSHFQDKIHDFKNQSRANILETIRQNLAFAGLFVGVDQFITYKEQKNSPLSPEEIEAFIVDAFLNAITNETIKNFEISTEQIPTPFDFEENLRINLHLFCEQYQRTLILDIYRNDPKKLKAFLEAQKAVISDEDLTLLHNQMQSFFDRCTFFPLADDPLLHRFYKELTIVYNSQIALPGVEHYLNQYEKQPDLYALVKSDREFLYPFLNADNPIFLTEEDCIKLVERAKETLQAKNSHVVFKKKQSWQGSEFGFKLALERTIDQVGHDAPENTFRKVLEEHLKAIAEEDAALQELCSVKCSPLQALQTMISKEGLQTQDIEDTTKLVIRDMQHVIESMEVDFSYATVSENKKTLDQFVLGVRSSCNRLALIKLYEELEKEVGKEIAEKIMGDWSIISEEIRDSKRLLADEDNRRILAYAKGQLTLEEYQQGMSKLKERLKTGEVTANEAVVSKMFPKLAKAIKTLPRQYFEDFTQVLKRAFVNQQLNHPEKFLPSKDEKAIFSLFGLDSSAITANKEIVLKKIKYLIDHEVLNGQKIEDVSSVKEMQITIDKLAFAEKVKMANGEAKQARYLWRLVKERRVLRKAFEEIVKEVYEDLKKNQKLISKYVNFEAILEEVRKIYMSWCSEDIDRAILLPQKNHLLELMNREDFEKFNRTLQTKFRKYLSKEEMTTYKGYIVETMMEGIESGDQFSKDWGDPIDIGICQGWKDKQEILGVGVCYANVQRILLLLQRNAELGRPELSREALLEHVKILPIDRFNQVAYEQNLARTKEVSQSKAILKKLGVEKREIGGFCQIQQISDLQKFFSDVLEAPSIPSKHGIIQVSIFGETWGHALFLRFDKKRNVIRFYDPNKGLSKNFWVKCEDDFKFLNLQNEQEKLKYAKEKMLSCFIDLLKREYKGIKISYYSTYDIKLSLTEEVKKKTGQITKNISKIYKKTLGRIVNRST